MWPLMSSAFRCSFFEFDWLFVGFVTDYVLKHLDFNMPGSQTHQQTIARNYLATDASRLKRDMLDAALVRRQRLGRHVCEKRGGDAIFFKNRWFRCGWAASILIW